MYPLKLLPARLRYTIYGVPIALLLTQFLWEQPVLPENPRADEDDDGIGGPAAPPRKRGRPRKDAPPVPTSLKKASGTASSHSTFLLPWKLMSGLEKSLGSSPPPFSAHAR